MLTSLLVLADELRAIVQARCTQAQDHTTGDQPIHIVRGDALSQTKGVQ